MITTLHRGGYDEMITVLHRGVRPNDYNITYGGGSLGTPKSDYVICARPPTESRKRRVSALVSRGT